MDDAEGSGKGARDVGTDSLIPPRLILEHLNRCLAVEAEERGSERPVNT